MYFLASLISFAINIYVLIIILQVAMSWLIALDIVNSTNDAAIKLTTLLKKLTDPVFVPLRKYVPPIGGLDLSPLIVIIGLKILGSLLTRMLFGVYVPY